MITMRSQNKRKGALIETMRAARQYVVVQSTKVIIEKWITKEVTVLGDSRTWQLGWYLVTQIVRDNLSDPRSHAFSQNATNVLNHIGKFL